MPIMIHDKSYVTVAERVAQAHKDCERLTITTEVLFQENAVVIKATVTTPKGVFTGISAANPSKTIEKQSPYEVAETSAVGRALGFAGFGSTEDIASADEMAKAGAVSESDEAWLNKTSQEHEATKSQEMPREKRVCSAHDEPVVMFRGVSKSKLDANGNPKEYWWHKGENGQMCFGSGYVS